MFDWNDEELTNIIWGEAGESGDHIVPYPDQIEEKPRILFGDSTKKESNRETSEVALVELKKSTSRTEHGVELECGLKYDTGDPATGLDLHSWPEPSLNAEKVNRDSMIPAASIKTELSKSCSFKDETAQFDKESETFQNQLDGREEGDFVDYGWANIGSFDDLDRIFSNSDPIFGDVTVGTADERWSSSKDVNSSTLRASLFPGDSSELVHGAIRNSSEKFEAEYRDSSQSFLPGYQNFNKIMTGYRQDVQASIDTLEHSGGKSKLLMKEETNVEMGRKRQVFHMQLNDGAAATNNEYPDKGNRKKRLLKGQKLEEKSEVRQLHDLCSPWPSCVSSFQQSNDHNGPSMVNQHPAFMPSQQSQLQRPETLHQRPGPLLTSPAYGHMVNQYPSVSIFPLFHTAEGNHKPVSSDYEVSPGSSNSLNKSMDTAVKPSAMTPQEKIEKLRRRQQMRAILAIQKQQQQFNNQVPGIEHSTMEGANIEGDENLCSFTSLDPNSPLEQDDSATVDVAFDDCSVEDSILYRLQETIANLDIRIRLCIRDSLFRLAQSATQRQYSSDTSRTNASSKDEFLSKNKGNNPDRFMKLPGVETETNPIDRIVAHLLFHRPLELPGKPPETPESPISAKIPYEKKATLLKTSPTGYFLESSEKATSLKNSLTGYFLESSENTEIKSPLGSKTLSMFSEGDQSKNGLCLDTSENASNTEAADEGVTKMETS